MILEKKNLDAHFEPVDYDPFSGPEIICVIPTMESQQEIWISCQLGGGDANRSYNESVSLKLKGNFSMSVLDRSLSEIVQRHEALRSTISADGNQICIYRNIPFKLRFEDISVLSFTEQEILIRNFSKQSVIEVFDLVNGPLFKAILFKLKDDEHDLIIAAHHIICDGWSLSVILQEMGKLYTAFAGNLSPDIGPAPSFVEYSIRQAQFLETEECEKTDKYWIDQYPLPVPVLDLPFDFPRPDQRTYKSNREDFPMNPELISALKKLGAPWGCTLVTMLMTAFEILLHRLTGQSDIVVGIPSAGQSSAGLQGLVGHCVNLLPIRSRHDGNLSFLQYLKLRKNRILEDYDHRQVTFGRLLKKLNMHRDASRIPLVQVMFNIDMGLDEGVHFEGLDHQIVYNPRDYESFEIFVNVSGSEKSMVLEWSYNTQIYKSDTIADWMNAFENLLHGVVADPSQLIKTIPLFSSEKLCKNLDQWNATETDYPRNKPLHELIGETAGRFPDRTAIRFGDSIFSYSHMNERANQLSILLKDMGIEKEDIVGLAIDRSPELIIALLAIMKSGAAYLPLDPGYPKDRIEFMLKDASAKILLTSGKYSGLFETGGKELLIEKAFDKISSYTSLDEETNSSGSNLAYVLYTSGSSGVPKGVMVEHRSLVNLLLAMQEFTGITKEDRLLAITTISFDLAGLEIFLPLLSGAEVVLASDEDQRDGRSLLDIMRKDGITMMQATPSVYKMLLDTGWKEHLNVKLLSCGEALSRDIAYGLIPNCNDLINLYGPTETTICSTGTRVNLTDKIITIGRPLANTRIYILDQYGNLVPEGRIGELYIGGDGLARGYLNRPDQQAEKFLPDPFLAGKEERMYRSGDLARYLPDGNLEYCGRADNQIKIRGFRIEPAEIEYVMQQYAGVLQAVVIARDNKLNDKTLIAYVVTSGIFDKEGLLNYLKDKLPHYMVPRIIIPLEKIPLTNNKKVDRNALPDPFPSERLTDRKIRKAVTETQKMMEAIWKDALHLPELSIDDNFFEIGGHSLIAIRLIKVIEEKTNKRFPVTALFESPTIEKLSLYVDQDERTVSWKSLVPIKPDGNKPPLYLIHGSGLTVLNFLELARGLDSDQPVFGLQAKGLNGIDEPFDNIEEISAYYVSEILEQNAQGPFNLAGYSFGGLVAFEMAKQFEARGLVVNMVGVFDTYVDQSNLLDPFLVRFGKKLKRQYPKFRYILGKFRQDPRKALAYQLEYVKRKMAPLLVYFHLIEKPTDKDLFLEHADRINDKHVEAFNKYRLTPYNGTIDLFRVKERMYYFDDLINLGWKPYVKGELNVHDTPGNHETFLQEPNVRELSRLMGKILKERNGINT